MQQLQLTIDQDSQLLQRAGQRRALPTLPDRPSSPDRPHPWRTSTCLIKAPRVASQLWSATELGKELGQRAQTIGRLANQHQLKRPAFGSTALTRRSAAGSRSNASSTTERAGTKSPD